MGSFWSSLFSPLSSSLKASCIKRWWAEQRKLGKAARKAEKTYSLLSSKKKNFKGEMNLISVFRQNKIIDIYIYFLLLLSGFTSSRGSGQLTDDRSHSSPLKPRLNKRAGFGRSHQGGPSDSLSDRLETNTARQSLPSVHLKATSISQAPLPLTASAHSKRLLITAANQISQALLLLLAE